MNVHSAEPTASALASTPDLLSTLTIRGVTLRSRIVLSPMCQYSSFEGLANVWHMVHLGSRGRRSVTGVCRSDRGGARGPHHSR